MRIASSRSRSSSSISASVTVTATAPTPAVVRRDRKERSGRHAPDVDRGGHNLLRGARGARAVSEAARLRLGVRRLHGPDRLGIIYRGVK